MTNRYGAERPAHIPGMTHLAEIRFTAQPGNGPTLTATEPGDPLPAHPERGSNYHGVPGII